MRAYVSMKGCKERGKGKTRIRTSNKWTWMNIETGVINFDLN